MNVLHIHTCRHINKMNKSFLKKKEKLERMERYLPAIFRKHVCVLGMESGLGSKLICV